MPQQSIPNQTALVLVIVWAMAFLIAFPMSYFVTYYFAKRKNKNAVIWGVFGAFSGLVPALLVLMVATYLCPKCRKALSNRESKTDKCPHCGASLVGKQDWAEDVGRRLTFALLAFMGPVIASVLLFPFGWGFVGFLAGCAVGGIGPAATCGTAARCPRRPMIFAAVIPSARTCRT